MKSINIEDYYQKYLKQVKLDEGKMSDTQKTETRRAFYAGFTEFYTMLGSLDQNPAAYVLQMTTIGNQLAVFWTNQIKEDKKINN